jgi:hypothetical protein
LDPGIQFGMTDELALGPRDIDQGEIAAGKRIAMALVAADAPHLRVQQGSNLSLVPTGEVENEIPHRRSVPGSSRRMKSRLSADRS